MSVPHLTLLDGHTIPQLGYGLWRVDDSQAASLVQTAIECGYRLIDTAMIYENERGVGEGVRASGVPRGELFVTTKLWNDDQADSRAGFDASMQRLQLDYVDLYLMHWPSPPRGLYVDAWHGMVELHGEGRARSIGVSNFNADHLERIIDASGVVPVVNQIELHPYFQQRELRAFHATHDIVTEAWSPLGQGGELLADPVLQQIAATHGVTTAQVVLRWHLQIGTVAIPKSVTPARIVQNIDVLGFELSRDELGRIAELDRNDGRIGPDPLTASF